MVQVKVKWGKETYTVDVELDHTVAQLKEKLASLTSVPTEKQKLMGLKPGAKDEAALSAAGVTAGKTLMMIGSADTSVPKVEAAAVDDGQGGHGESVPTSNGLNNIGNTCYMNSAVEMVRTVPEIKESVAADSPAVRNNTFLRALGDLLTTLDTTRDAVTPIPFWSQLVTLNPMFGERSEEGHLMQHDAQEALSTMLQQITSVLPAKYARLFQGTVQQTLKCNEIADDAGNVSSAPFSMLQCNIGGEVQTLEAGLAQAFNETFDAQSDALQKQAKFTKTSRLSALPEYLFVHMVRFSWKNDVQKKAKILKPITFPLILDLAHLCTEDLNREMKPTRQVISERRDKEVEKRKRGRSEKVEAEEPITEVVPQELHNESGYFELCGVISHKGRSSDGGHYVYWGKKANHWLIYDDQHVAEVSEEDILRLRGVGEAHIAYVLLYRSREPTTKKPVVPL